VLSRAAERLGGSGALHFETCLSAAQLGTDRRRARPACGMTGSSRSKDNTWTTENGTWINNRAIEQ
jgi:hypothetical protein